MGIEQIKIPPIGDVVSIYPIATRIVEMIRSDAENGILQTDQGYHNYWSSEYIHDKSNWMFPNQQSNRTSSVDMILTGQLMSSLAVKEVTNDNTQAIIEYSDPEAEEKIRFNEDKFGRYVTTINSTNYDEIDVGIVEKLQQKLQELADLEISEIIEV